MILIYKKDMYSLINSAVSAKHLGLAPVHNKDDVRQHATSRPFDVEPYTRRVASSQSPTHFPSVWHHEAHYRTNLTTVTFVTLIQHTWVHSCEFKFARLCVCVGVRVCVCPCVCVCVCVCVCALRSRASVCVGQCAWLGTCWLTTVW